MADLAITTGFGNAGMGGAPAGIPIAPEYQARLEEAQARKAQQASQGSGYNPFTLYKDKEVCYSPGMWAFRRIVEDTVGSEGSFNKTAKFFMGESAYADATKAAKLDKMRTALTHNEWLKNQHGQFEGWTGKQSYFEKLYASNPHEGINKAFKQTFKNWDEKTPITTGDLKAATDTGHLSLDGIKTAAQSASALSYDELFGMHDAEKARIQAVVREEGKVAGLKQIFSKDRWQYGKEVLSEGKASSTATQRAGIFTKKVLWNNEVKWATEPAKQGQWIGAVLRPLAVGLATWDVLSTTARAFKVSRQKGDGFFTSCAKALGTFIVKSIKTAFLWSLGTAAAWAVGAALSVFALPAIAATVLTVLGAAAITYGAHRLMNCVIPDPPCTT